MRVLFLAVVVLALSGAVGRAATTHGPLLPSSPVFSPDGTQIAWSDTNTNRVWIANADGSDAHPVGPVFRQGPGQVAWTKYGLVVIDSNYTLYRLTPAGKRWELGIVGDTSFTVGGSRVASGSAGCGFCHSPVTVYDLRTHTRSVIGSPSRSNWDPALSPDGSHLVYERASCGPPDGDCDKHPALVEAAVGGSGSRVLSGFGGCYRWSPNGRWLSYFGRRSLAIMTIATGKSQLLLPHFLVCNSDAEPGWSPDSTELALPTSPGPLMVVNVRTHVVRRTSRALGDVEQFAWSPDGSSLIVSARPNPNDGGCFSLWRLDATTLRGNRVVAGCQ